MIRFQFNESKAVEALVFIAQRWPDITPFYLSKVLFFADRDHLRQYGRPVLGDSYIAMDNGPVPSRVYDIVKGNLDFFGDPAAIKSALRMDRAAQPHTISAEREPNTAQFSETDIAALSAAIDFCKGKSFSYLSNLTHNEEAWSSAARNAEMELELLVPEEQREEVRETAAYAVF
jgi:uncharacterized phage-associated protein